VEEVGVAYDAPRWRMPERPRTRVRPDSDDEEFQAWGRFNRDGESSDEEGLPTNLKVGGKGTSRRKAERARRRAAKAAAAAAAAARAEGEQSGVPDEEALWKQTLKQAARAEEDQRAITKETARISQLLLAGAQKSIEPIPLPEKTLGDAPLSDASHAGFMFDFKGNKLNASAGSTDGDMKRQRLAISATGLAGEVLLPNWLAARDEAGTTYYFNTATLESSWEPPLRWPCMDDSTMDPA